MITETGENRYQQLIVLNLIRLPCKSHYDFFEVDKVIVVIMLSAIFENVVHQVSGQHDKVNQSLRMQLIHIANEFPEIIVKVIEVAYRIIHSSVPKNFSKTVEPSTHV